MPKLDQMFIITRHAEKKLEALMPTMGNSSLWTRLIFDFEGH